MSERRDQLPNNVLRCRKIGPVASVNDRQCRSSLWPPSSACRQPTRHHLLCHSVFGHAHIGTLRAAQRCSKARQQNASASPCQKCLIVCCRRPNDHCTHQPDTIADDRTCLCHSTRHATTSLCVFRKQRQLQRHRKSKPKPTRPACDVCYLYPFHSPLCDCSLDPAVWGFFAASVRMLFVAWRIFRRVFPPFLARSLSLFVWRGGIGYSHV
jgi:hypothetical protein